MSNFFKLDSEQLETLKIQVHTRNYGLSQFATKDKAYIRRYKSRADEDVCRSGFVVDVDKILHNLFYNRYTDKTQVFSFYTNDDLTRRSLHVQLVSRIARTIGQALNLNLDLIEAIALGHDIGHTPFGHKGELFLNIKYNEKTGRYFNHNVHSVRALQTITNSNLTLQTLDGILCHNGEKMFSQYQPEPIYSFKEFDKKVESCYIDKAAITKLVPCTLEGCVVRISDMIAYVGKDRQDAGRVKKCRKGKFSHSGILGVTNGEIIGNMIINVVKNSLGKDFLKIDDDVYKDLAALIKENYEIIYGDTEIVEAYDEIIKPMMFNLYEKLLDDIKKKNYSSPIFMHHVNYSILYDFYRPRGSSLKIEPNEVVVDFIASMTDDYFIDLHKFLFPDSKLTVEYKSYFRDYL